MRRNAHAGENMPAWAFLRMHGNFCYIIVPPRFRGFSDAVNGLLGLHLFYRVEKVCGKNEIFFTIYLSHRRLIKGGEN